MSILVFNAGSTSLKFGLFDANTCDRLVAGDIDWANGDRQNAQLQVRQRNGVAVKSRVSVPDHAAASACAIDAALSAEKSAEGRPLEISAVGHRVVHGGAEFRQSIRVDDKVKTAIARLCELAPLHNPPALKAIEAAEAALPGKPAVAVFDTAFFAQLPPKSYLFGVPYAWYENWGIRRFGFHGTSHAFCSRRAADLMGRELRQLRIVCCHLGGGCSAAGVRNGMGAATTIGFSPLDGLMMGTRCGAIDPGILLHLQSQCGLTVQEISRDLNYSSGLLGVSGVSQHLAEIEAAAAQGNARAKIAFDMFADQVRGAIASLTASLGGLDALTFTDRIGEGSPALRAAVCEGLQFMGIHLDPERNAAAKPDMDISKPGSAVPIFVIHTEEEWMIARETARVIGLT